MPLEILDLIERILREAADLLCAFCQGGKPSFRLAEKMPVEIGRNRLSFISEIAHQGFHPRLEGEEKDLELGAVFDQRADTKGLTRAGRSFE